MNQDKKDRILKCLVKIEDDTENDAISLDGQPFNGKIVATQFGNTLAAIGALSKLLQLILEELPVEETPVLGLNQITTT